MGSYVEDREVQGMRFGYCLPLLLEDQCPFVLFVCQVSVGEGEKEGIGGREGGKEGWKSRRARGRGMERGRRNLGRKDGR